MIDDGIFLESVVKNKIIIIIGLLLSTYLQAAVASAPAPLLPTNRIVGYYGNFYSTKMGVLGEYPLEEMLGMLRKEVNKWTKADPKTPVIPAIEYIAIVAQNHPGQDGKYRARMPDAQIQKALAAAKEVNGIVILDIQTGLSNVEAEIAHLAEYLKLPNVMLALDPEFSMPPDTAPGKVIGSMDAKDINYAINYLSELVQKHNLPPKVLIVHRFTKHMVTNHELIKPASGVQVVMDMDGWGSQARKLDTYRAYIAPEVVQFTGVKLFYHQDLKQAGPGLFTPEEILNFKPVPSFILFQ
jgi:hypothetical protein